MSFRMTINALAMSSTYHGIFLALVVSGYQCYLSDWVSSIRRDDTRFTLSRRHVFQTQLRYSYTPSRRFPLFIYLLAPTL